eukprot:Hpha_TRINITY_DN449_c0_g1::TRINITY_DN449_c0_g1_i1::g.27765::m.27765
MPGNYPYDLTSPEVGGAADRHRHQDPRQPGDGDEDEEEAFNVDVMQGRKAAPIAWMDLEGQDIPFAVLDAGSYVVRLWNNSSRKKVARVNVDGKPLGCLYRLAPHSKHTVKGRRVSRSEVLPFSFRASTKDPRSLARLPKRKVLDLVGSVEVQFFHAEEDPGRVSWRNSGTRGGGWGSTSNEDLHSTTSFSAPEVASRGTAEGAWKPGELDAAVTIFLIDATQSEALGLREEDGGMEGPSPVPPPATSAMGRGEPPPPPPPDRSQRQIEALVTRAEKAEAEAALWQKRFFELRDWVGTHLKGSTGSAVFPPGPRSPRPRSSQPQRSPGRAPRTSSLQPQTRRS